MKEIKVLQIGKKNWSQIYKLPEQIEFTYAEYFRQNKDSKLLYDIVFLDREITEEEAKALYKVTRAYTLYVTSQVELCGELEWLYRCKKGKRLEKEQIQQFLLEEAKYFYPQPYGEKFSHQNLDVSRNFTGTVSWEGNYCLILNGEFGETYTQAAFWRKSIPIQQEQTLDLWLEYEKDPGISIELTVIEFLFGSISEVCQSWKFDEEQLKNVVQITAKRKGNLFFSIRAKGCGKLKVIALHDRYSRGTHGYFLPGGERYVTSKREELFAYFDPGDLKPPLNVYFSGYKTMEGFEGYYMMRKLGSPFLLISEARLEGGCFYMGTEEYEQMVENVIRKYVNELGFSENEVIFSGLSMGTYGSLYYGCDIRPHAILLGKPLTSIGTVAANEKRIRPGGFPTSLDVLRYLCGNTDDAAVKQLNEKFWDKFNRAEWNKTKLIVSYMIEDDYDANAYQDMISHLTLDGIQIYGKGMHGRHNDNSGGIISWFISQFEKILREDFDREKEE